MEYNSLSGQTLDVLLDRDCFVPNQPPVKKYKLSPEELNKLLKESTPEVDQKYVPRSLLRKYDDECEKRDTPPKKKAVDSKKKKEKIDKNPSAKKTKKPTDNPAKVNVKLNKPARRRLASLPCRVDLSDPIYDGKESVFLKFDRGATYITFTCLNCKGRFGYRNGLRPAKYCSQKCHQEYSKEHGLKKMVKKIVSEEEWPNYIGQKIHVMLYNKQSLALIKVCECGCGKVFATTTTHKGKFASRSCAMRNRYAKQREKYPECKLPKCTKKVKGENYSYCSMKCYKESRKAKNRKEIQERQKAFEDYHSRFVGSFDTNKAPNSKKQKCVFCNSEKTKKRGKTKSGKQSYYCHDCGKIWTPNPGRSLYKEEFKRNVVQMVLNDGKSPYFISKKINVPRHTILRWVKEYEQKKSIGTNN